ncbi:RelA/SpoT family protein [Flavobacteriaceae bacterium]|nr:RelA/SpoT family protein [Flavobacteriaceae bacterium]
MVASIKKLLEEISRNNIVINNDRLLKAYDLAYKSHSNQTRHSGEPYITHPLEVAIILVEMGLDEDSIITALLHDTVEDSSVTLGQIKINFGQKVSHLVEGVTKLKKISNLSKKDSDDENIRRLCIAMSQDIRVLIVKLADRLHNMRTINFVKNADSRLKKAKETISIYGPLAARIGMYKIKDELMDISFAQINPEVRNQIIKKTTDIYKQKEDKISYIIKYLEDLVKPHLDKFKIMGRNKNPYSIWNKMKKKNIGLNYINDIMGFRIIVPEQLDCYKILGVINSKFHMIPKTFDDYISSPKDNNYQSIHFSIVGPKNRKMEIQIRTFEMNEVAENGIASHWSYKDQIKLNGKGVQYEWTQELAAILAESESAEVIGNYQLKMHDDQIFCFSPNGDVFNLPKGATAIDFAYAIHSDMGNQLSGVKINGLNVSIQTKIENGDQIEIFTDKNAFPSISWVQFSVTAKVRYSIRNFIRNKKHKEYEALGRGILDKFFSEKNLKINDKILAKSLYFFRKNSVNDIYIFVAEGAISRNEILKFLYPDYKDSKVVPYLSKQNLTSAISLEGFHPNMFVKFSQCCHPVPNEKIVGVVNIGSDIAIHYAKCSMLQKISHNIINIDWDDVAKKQEDLFPARFIITLKNESGSLAEMSNIIAKSDINIKNIDICNRTEEFFEVEVNIEIENIDILESVIASLGLCSSVVDVKR